MKRYRCKHVVEAMQWKDTEENREAFYQWFLSHDEMFCTRGSVLVLSHAHSEEDAMVAEGEWVIHDGEEFLRKDGEIADSYEEVP